MKKQAFNPYLPSYEYVPDGEPFVYKNRIYIFGSHDKFDGDDFCLNDYVCWSAPTDDLGNWQNDGIIYKVTQDPLNTDGSQQGFAPDLRQGIDGRFYLYYCLSRSPFVSVAVCYTISGKYEFYGHVHHQNGSIYGAAKGDPFNFDPGVLIDKGKVYLYTGFSPANGYLRSMLEQSGLLINGSYCVELDSDMLTVKTAPVLVAPGQAVSNATSFEGHAFYEASSPRKIDNSYYLIFSSELSHELCYAVSDKPDGEYTYGGTIISIGDIGLNNSSKAVNYIGNTHGGIVQINNQWYVFYHRQTNCHRNSRQGCAEKIFIQNNGKIVQVEMTSCGLNSSPLIAEGEYEARIACNLSSKNGVYEYTNKKNTDGIHPYFTQSGIDRESDGDQYIANVRDGSWAGYKYFDFNNEKEITVSVRGTANGVISVSTEESCLPAAQIQITPTENWTEFKAELAELQGVHALYFYFKGTGVLDFNIFRIKS